MNDFTIQTMDELSRRYYGTTGEKKRSSASKGCRSGSGHLTSDDELKLKDIIDSGSAAGGASGRGSTSRSYGAGANTGKGGTISLQDLAGK